MWSSHILYDIPTYLESIKIYQVLPSDSFYSSILLMDNNPIRKDWFDAVRAYHELAYHSPITFLNSDHAVDNGLGPDDIREFRQAVQSFNKKWQVAARAYIEGKFTTPKKFVSSGKFLKIGFVPSRDHVAVLGFAIKFYEEDAKYRQNVESSAVAAIGKYGGSIKPMYSASKSRMSHRVVGLEKYTMDEGSIPTLVDVNISDDSSTESSSRLSDDRSEILSAFEKPRAYAVSKRYREITMDRSDFARVLFCELSMERPHRNPIDAMMFFVFAIIPLLVFAKIRAILALVLPIEASPLKNECSPENVDDEWKEIRANALLLDEQYDFDMDKLLL
jgi:hypothetical protein